LPFGLPGLKQRRSPGSLFLAFVILVMSQVEDRGMVTCRLDVLMTGDKQCLFRVPVNFGSVGLIGEAGST
jgi:hypothetical protein